MNRFPPWLQRPCFVLVCLLTLATGCREDEVSPDDTTNPPDPAYAAINAWISKEMNFWYYWNDELPARTDNGADPQTYFEALLHREDRFSWIQENYQELLNALQGVSREAGYEFALYREKPGSDKVLMQILYVKPDSPAEDAGLRRGDLVTHVNGNALSLGNYRDMLEATRDPHTLTYQALLLPEKADFATPATVSLSTVEYAENPNYLHKVIEAGGKKIGYLVHNFFANGTDRQPGAYDAETDAIFGEFKAQGIDELVVDLRFNSGGTESSARHLASLIGRGIDDSKIFLKRQYNEDVQAAILQDDNLGEDFLVTHFEKKANNVGEQLASGRVYILTGTRTASASELVINALKPFMEVFLIGDTTVGKNVGSISIYEEDNPDNTWGMQPIVVKVLNSQGQADYSHGFVPDIIRPDNKLVLYPLGDPRENLLSAALTEITGGMPSRTALSTRRAIATSLDSKRRTNHLIVDAPHMGTLP